MRELRDKTAELKLVASERVEELDGAADGAEGGASELDDAVSALVNLGYKPVDARRAVDSAAAREGGAKRGLEVIIRESLRCWPVKGKPQMEEAEAGAEAARLAAAGQSEEDARSTSRCARARSASSSGRSARGKSSACRSRLRASAAKCSTMCFFPGRRDSARPRSPISSRASSACNMRATSGPAIERAGDLAAIVSDLDEGDVLFIDEIHRLARPVEEVLYPAMEDFELNIVVGKGTGARTMPLAVKPFTLVGATTRSGLLSSPLRDRFGQHFHLDFYDRDELTEIVARSARLLGVRVDDRGAHEIACRSRGTPRIANRLLRRVRDFAQVNEAATVTREVAVGALELLEIDACGFDRMDRAILAAIIDKFDGGPVGVESLAAAVGEEADTIGEVYEPYLLQEGFIARTARGRIATARAYSHLGRTRRGTLL